MNSDKNAEDSPRKETQQFDPALVDREEIRPDAAEDVEPIILEQEQTDKEVEEKTGHSGGWHQFKTP
jgi:hypothetical protein